MELDSRPDVVALLIRGAGDKFFCAGADLNMFVEGDVERARQVVRLWQGLRGADPFSRGQHRRHQWLCHEAALEVALACDIRIAEQRALLGLPEASVRLLPCAGAPAPDRAGGTAGASG